MDSQMQISILGAAGLLAICASGLIWYYLHLKSMKSLLVSRMTNVSDMKFPYTMEEKAKEPAAVSVSLEESYSSKLARNLYLAGFRDKKILPLVTLIMRVCMILPVIVLLIAVLTNSLSQTTLARAVVVGLGPYILLTFYVSSKRKKIERQMTRTLPQILDLLTVSLEAGMNFSAALPRVLDEMEPENVLIKEFRTVQHEYLGGLSFPQACERMGKRCESPDLTVILTAIIESEQTGTSLAHVLRVHSHDLRDKYRQRLREKAHKLPTKLLFPMIFIFITIFTIALGPSAFRMQQQIKTLKSDDASGGFFNDDQGTSRQQNSE